MHYVSLVLLLAAILIGVPFLDQATESKPDTSGDEAHITSGESDP
jgi:hypothetical protein